MKSLPQALADAHAVKQELAGEVLILSGRLRLGVTGSSMLPTVWPGDTLVIERASSDAVSKGDIVLFQRDGRFFVHRVVGKIAGDSMILTRGDAMLRPDPPVAGRCLLGKVVSIVRQGKRIRPKTDMGLSSRAVAAAVRRSETAARVVVGVHGMLQSLRGQNSNHRAMPCQS
jgi:signal peptidase I